MILPLRQRHRRMVMALSIALPIALVAGIVARKPVPTMASLPMGLAPSPQAFTVLEWERTDLFTKTPMRVRLMRPGVNTERLGLLFDAPKDFVKPDLIVYWVVENPSIANKLPEDAMLLGAFDTSVTLPLPASIKPGSGALVLYSLADQEIVEVSNPVTLLKQ